MGEGAEQARGGTRHRAEEGRVGVCLPPFRPAFPPIAGRRGVYLPPFPLRTGLKRGRRVCACLLPPPAAAAAPFFSLPNPRVPLTPASAVRRAFVCVRALPAVRAWGCPHLGFFGY